MDKPKITEGEWDFNDNGRIYVWGNGPETKGYTPNIAKVSIWKDDPEQGKANAQTIAAAKKMRNALIGLVFDYYEQNDLSPAIKEAKKALEKAGVKRQ